MNRTIPESAREHADLALAVYVEELAARRRVLFVGDASSAVPERLSSVARSVEVVSPRTRARGTRRGGRILPRPWPSAQDARSWDLVLVPDLLWAGPPAPERIAEMSEWLTARGVLVVGAEEREDGIGYEGLYELLSRRFDQVRMLGQAPFAGWTLVDFAPQTRELEVTFDGSLLGGSGEEPARFLALCAAREVVLDPYAVIQVPSSTQREPRVVDRAAAPREAVARDATPTSRDDSQLQARLSQLEVQLEDRRGDVVRAGERSTELERELTAVRARVEHAERRVEQAQREIARGAQKLDEARGRADALSAELDAARAAIAQIRAEAAVSDVDEEYQRLEATLADRGRELTSLRVEIERRGVLVRDLVEELRETRARGGAAVSSPPAPEGGGGERAEQLERSLEAARQRAVQAEASAAEAGFKLDEVRGQLALCRREREAERETAARERAETAGRVRGLVARLAETEEMRRQSEGRLALAQDDVVSARMKIRELERDVAMANEQIELGMVRAQGAPGERSAPSEEPLAARLASLETEAAEREGRMYGALMQAREKVAELSGERTRLMRELARAEQNVGGAEDRSREDRAALETRLGQLADEATRALAESERSAREASTLRGRTDALARDAAVARGERDGLRLRLADAEAALEATRTAVPAAAAPAIDASEVHDLRQRVEVLGASVAVWTQRANEALERASGADDLAVRLSARDALIGRVQRELADASARRDSLDRRVRELDATVLQLREQIDQSRAISDVRADEDRREAGRLEQRVTEVERARERAEREHEQTRQALGEARQILSSIATGLESGVSGAGGGADPRAIEQLHQLQRDAQDREVMLRSLTAQLQDRDDRIRALERLSSEGVPGDERELAQRVVLAEERTVRLERELEQERTARRIAEQSTGGAERDVEMRRLSQMLGDRDAQLMVLEGRMTSSEREHRAMRDAFAQARAGLETLLGDIANDQRAEAADRIASMLRSLRRY